MTRHCDHSGLCTKDWTHEAHGQAALSSPTPLYFLLLDGGLELGLDGKPRAETLIRAGGVSTKILSRRECLQSALQPSPLPRVAELKLKEGSQPEVGACVSGGPTLRAPPAEEGPGQELEGTCAWMSDACNASVVCLVLLLSYRARALETSGVSGRFPHLSGPRTPRC